MPAMIKYGMRRASLEIGAGDNVICAWSAGAKPLLETLTPNNTSPYVTTDLRKAGVSTPPLNSGVSCTRTHIL
jgi:hypothetical protein